MEDTEIKPLRLTDNKRQILVAIAQQPRKAKSFTHGDFARQMHPDVIGGWLAELAAHGLVYEAEGSFHITTKGRQKINQGREDEFRTAGTRNVMQQGSYSGEQGQYIRPGSDHSHLKSFGVPC